MKLSRYPVLMLAVALGLPVLLFAKEKASEGKQVDSGAFGVFMGGRRVATETFTISETSSGSLVHSDFKADSGTDHAVQTSDLQLSPTGEIRRYEFKELSPGKSEAVLTPSDQFLMQKSTMGPQDKPQEQPYLLPASTSVLDDYFFVQREVLAWKFLQMSCKRENGQLKCPLKQRAQFGTVNPHQRSSAPVTMEYMGQEKVAIHGADRDLMKLELKSEAGIWDMWLDDQFKVLRISIPSENTEVVRD